MFAEFGMTRAGAQEFEGRGRVLRLMRAGKVTGWVLITLLTLQAACGGALKGGASRSLLPHASAGFNLFSPEQDIQLGEASAEEIRRQVVVVRDKRTQAYVQRLRGPGAAGAAGR